MHRIHLIIMGLSVINQALMWYADASADREITREEYAQLGAMMAGALGNILGFEVTVDIKPKPQIPPVTLTPRPGV